MTSYSRGFAPEWIWLDYYQFPDFEITFIGQDSHHFQTPVFPDSHFWLGSEKGRILNINKAGQKVRDYPNASPSQSAINGIAFSCGRLAISTPEEVSIYSLPDMDRIKPGVILPLGAHGVTIAPSSGHFVLPAGRSGLILISPDADTKTAVPFLEPCKPIRVFYKVIALQSPIPNPETNQRLDFLVCACRGGGLGIMEYSPHQEGKETYNMQVSSLVVEGESSSEVDVVDVCHVGSDASQSCAVVALGRDGSLFLIPDLTRIANLPPKKMKFQTIQGSAYSVYSIQGHLFVLTSKGIYGLINLGQRVLEMAATGEDPKGDIGVPEPFETPIFVMEHKEMVDAGIVDNHWLMVILLDGLLQIDVAELAKNVPEQFRATPERAQVLSLLRDFKTVALPPIAVA